MHKLAMVITLVIAVVVDIVHMCRGDFKIISIQFQKEIDG